MLSHLQILFFNRQVEKATLVIFLSKINKLCHLSSFISLFLSLPLAQRV